MDWTALAKAVVLGLVEGLTEFLPVSSTGHLIVVEDLFGMNDEKGKVLAIVIQLGAILAVCWEYRARFTRAIVGLPRDPLQRRFVANLAIAFLPAAAVGFLLASAIKAHLYTPQVVAMALIAGAALIFVVEAWYGRQPAPRVTSVDDMRWTDALKVGLAQCLALIPGTSRSGATILGGMAFGLSRPVATEFSFFLAVPMMFAASLYQGLSHHDLFQMADVPTVTVAFVVSFVTGLAAVRWLLRYVAARDYRPFAWYRIALGLAILAYF